MSIGYYDREGKPLELLEWARLLEDNAYKRVARDVLDNGRVVSTVWLGLGHNLGTYGPPLIFETMVFPPHDEEHLFDDELECGRYATEEEAREGHARMVAKWAAP
jgi:hypothetical protein